MLDFLALRFDEDEQIVRTAGEFVTRRPWALARFGRLLLKSGWWVFNCQGDSDTASVELRLSSAADPLIVVPAGEPINLYLRGDEAYDISVLLSSWPSRQRFSELSMRRLSNREQLTLIFAGAGRVLSRKNAPAVFMQLARRVLARQTLGVRADRRGSNAPTVTANPAIDPPQEIASSQAFSRVAKNGISAVLRCGDEIDPRAFEVVLQEFSRRPELEAAYGDISIAGRIVPRPEWDGELAHWASYIDSPVFFRREVEGDPWPAVLEIVGRKGSRGVARIPLPLASRAAELSIGAPFRPPHTLASEPRVSIVIPTKYQVDLLEKNLNALVEITGYPNLEVVIVDNGCADPRFPSMLASFAGRLDIVQVRDHGPFNFSRLINAGVASASGQIVVLLNDDVEPIESGWLHRMVSSASQPDVGAVGARLLYPDGSIQHAGVIMGIGGIAGHLWKGRGPGDAERNPYIANPSSRLAVTGACLAVRKDAFDSLGGFDERFAVALNDIDFCLRLQRIGLRTVYRGDAVLIHHESRSRGLDDRSVASRKRLAAETRLFMELWRDHLRDDPFGSPAFDLTSEQGTVHRAIARAGAALNPGDGQIANST